jgi:hypothetical protein
MLLSKKIRDIFKSPRLDVAVDHYTLIKEQVKSIEGVNYKPSLMKYRDLRGKDLNHSNFVHQLYDVTIDNMPYGSRLKGKYMRDSTGPRLEAISENNLVISLCVSKRGRIFYSIYYRALEDFKKNIILIYIRRAYPDAKILEKKNSVELIVFENYHTLDFNKINLLECANGFWNFIYNISKIKFDSRISDNGRPLISTASLVRRKSTVIRYYLAVSLSIYLAIRFAQTHLLPRGGGDGGRTFDIFDDIIVIGATEKALELYRLNNDNWKAPGIYREHAVPCKFLVDQAVKNYLENKSFRNLYDQIIDVALMIRRNLTLVYCTIEEARTLDYSYRLTMPDDWNPMCGDVLERFHKCDILVYDFDGYQFMKPQNKKQTCFNCNLFL